MHTFLLVLLEASFKVFLVTEVLHWYLSTSSTSSNCCRAVKCKGSITSSSGLSLVTCEGSSPLVSPGIRMDFVSFPLVEKSKKLLELAAQ